MAGTEAGVGAQAEREHVIDQAVRRVSTSFVIAAAIVAVAIWARPAPPRFEAIAADGKVYRVDTKTGTVLACVDSRCMVVVKRGQHLEHSLSIGIERARDVPAVKAPAPAQK